jgi:hypothetical protein
MPPQFRDFFAALSPRGHPWCARRCGSHARRRATLGALRCRQAPLRRRPSTIAIVVMKSSTSKGLQKYTT